uniref:Nose resistant-to-fluoxetine protein N-terminal domain-containing protein n=1 Tax=Plectus sambesii TaxID=2011161 RepID=A0A914ULF1_9BILA
MKLFLLALVGVSLLGANVHADEEDETTDPHDLLLTSMLTEFMKDSEVQLVLDLDLFRSLMEYSPDRLQEKINHNDISFWHKALNYLEPLKQYDVGPACFADVSYLIWDVIQFIKLNQASDQCIGTSVGADTDCPCLNETAPQLADKQWVFKVLDAMGKMPAGIMNGNNLFVGSWDTCRKISVPKNRQGHKWQGQYCMTYLQPYNKDNPLKNIGTGAKDTVDTSHCAAKTSQSESGNEQSGADDMKCFDMIPLLNYGMCLPDTCTEYDVKRIVEFLAHGVEMAANRSIVCNIDIICHNDEKDKLTNDPTSMWMLAFVILIVVFMVFGSVYDYFVYQEILRSFPESDHMKENSEIYETQSWFVKVLLAFSVYTNGKNILRAKKGPNQVHCLHGMRVLSMFWIILGHTYYYCATSLTMDNIIPTLVSFPLKFTNQIILQAPLAVDTFFFLSGMLMAYLWFKMTKKMKGKNITSPGFWGQFYFHRYVRLTPIYMIIMGLDVTLFTHFSDGPFWRPIEKNYCRISWWTNFIYMNNFLLQHVEQCMGWTWYLANDFQFYCFSPILLVLLWKRDWIGIGFSGALIFVASGIKLAITLVNDYPPAPLLTKNLQIVKDLSSYWPDLYIKPYTRCSPYIIGVLVGYFLYKYGLELKMKKWQVGLGWTLSTIGGLWSVFGLYDYSLTGEISQGMLIFYALLGRN